MVVVMGINRARVHVLRLIVLLGLRRALDDHFLICVRKTIGVGARRRTRRRPLLSSF